MPESSEVFRMNNGSFAHILGKVSECVASKYMQEIVEPHLRAVHTVLLSHLPFHYNGFRRLLPSDGRKKVLFPGEVLETWDHLVYGSPTAMELKRPDQSGEEQSTGSPPWGPDHHRTLCARSDSLRELGPWPMSEGVYRIKPGGIFDRFMGVIDATHYIPDFVLVGCDEGREEEIEVKDSEKMLGAMTKEIIPRKVHVFEVKSSNPSASRSYTPNQRKALNKLREVAEVSVLQIPVTLERDFVVNTYQ